MGFLSRQRRLAAGVALGLLLQVPGGAGGQPSGVDERETLARTQPTPLEAYGGPAPGPELLTLRVRFYADEEHRSGSLRVSDRLRRTLDAINPLVQAALGVTFVLESVKSWTRVNAKSGLDGALDELERLDPARDVDWVVGLVGPLPNGSREIHDVGVARGLGRHFVMRGLSSFAELSAFQRAFPNLERSNPAELHLLFSRRKEHQEAVVFLHEWAHTLGGLHVTDRTRMLFPTYARDTSLLGPADIGLLAAALKDRLAARGEIERASSAAEVQRVQQSIDWAHLRRFLRTTNAAEWAPGERADLLARLEGRKGSEPNAPALGVDEAEIHKRALALYRAQKDAAAWEMLAPVVEKSPRAPLLGPLLCRLSGVPAARARGQAACAAGIARALPDDEGPLIDAAYGALARGARDEALAHAREAELRAGRAGPPDAPAAWLSVAQIYNQLGAVGWAEQALAKASGRPQADVTRAQRELARTRRFFGLPATTLPPEQEAPYASAFLAANHAVSARKLGQARSLIEAALRRFGAVPGLQVLACDLAMRQGRLPAARKSCTSALAAMEDLPRAHYLVGHLAMAANDAPAAATAFRRAATLDPTMDGYWDMLAEVYTTLRRTKEAKALPAERARALAGSQ